MKCVLTHKHSLLFLLTIFLFLQHSSAIAQKDDLKNFFLFGKDLTLSPSKFNSSDIITFSAVSISVLSSFLADEDVKNFFTNSKSHFNNSLYNIDKYYHVESISVATAAIYIYGLSAKNENTRMLGLKLAESTLYASAITGIVKVLFGRGRPYLNEGNTEFSLFNFTQDRTSFPSGHTMLAFAFSIVIANEYNNFFWKLGWYAAASLVGGARIYHNMHWLSDVMLGAAIGYFVGDFVNKSNKINSSSGNNKNNFSVSFNLPF
jgi:membrane-associated phospholipid phosphatase